jgi:hypothetical protein
MLIATPLCAAATASHGGERNLVEFVTPLSHEKDRVDTYHDDAPRWYHTMADILGDQPVSGPVSHDLEAKLHLTYDDSERRSFTEVEGHAAWRTAMKANMDAVEKNRT